MSDRPEQTDTVPQHRSLANPRRLRASGAVRLADLRDRREPDPTGPDHRPA